MDTAHTLRAPCARPHAPPPAGDYARIVKDLATIGDTVDISTTKDAVKFATSGDIGTANVTVK
jgi:proliferating cell nuclear antigen